MKHFTVCDNGYKYDKRIFWVVKAGVIFLVFLVAYQLDFKFNYKFYYECNDYLCNNPLMDQEIKNSVTNYNYKLQCTEPWCNLAQLPRGVYGTKPPWAIKNFLWVTLWLVFIGLVSNHLSYNWGKVPSIKLNLSDKTLNKIKKIIREAK